LHVVGQPAAGGAAGQQPDGELDGQGPVDVAERPVGRQRRDGEHADHEQARPGRLPHAKAEDQQVHGHQEERAAVGQQAGEHPHQRGGGDEQQPVMAALGARLAG